MSHLDINKIKSQNMKITLTQHITQSAFIKWTGWTLAATMVMRIAP